MTLLLPAFTARISDPRPAAFRARALAEAAVVWGEGDVPRRGGDRTGLEQGESVPTGRALLQACSCVCVLARAWGCVLVLCVCVRVCVCVCVCVCVHALSSGLWLCQRLELPGSNRNKADKSSAVVELD